MTRTPTSFLIATDNAAVAACRSRSAGATPGDRGTRTAADTGGRRRRQADALQAQLHITDAQMPQWMAFAQAMRQNASSTGGIVTSVDIG